MLNLPTLGARIRARSPQRAGNSPFTPQRDPGLRAGILPASGPASTRARINVATAPEDAKAILGPRT